MTERDNILSRLSKAKKWLQGADNAEVRSLLTSVRDHVSGNVA